MAVGTAAAAGALSACQLASPLATEYPYDPADGVGVETADMEILDLIVISEAEDSPGVVAGYVVNTSKKAMSVSLAVESEGERVDLEPAVEVAPGAGLRLDGKTDDGDFANPVTVPSVPGIPGSVITIRMSSSGGDVTSARVPVFPPDGVYEPYRALIGS